VETLPSLPVASPLNASRTGLPLQAGAGFKPQHLEPWLADAQAPAFAEVHAENYMGAGGRTHAELTRLREHMPLSLHGVGLSIGSEGALDIAHLDRLTALISRYQPASFSEHLSWSTHHGVFLNDLLPLVYDQGTLARVCEHVDQVQTHLRTRLLLENPSTYFEFEASTFSEPEFLSQIVRRTGCGLLLDINNVHVTCFNNGRDPVAYLEALPLQTVGEVHLAGHAEHVDGDGHALLIDNHGAPVSDAVWKLYVGALESLGPVPTLIEWDTDVPRYERLRSEVRRAQTLLDALAHNASEVAA